MERRGAFDYILLETTGLADPGNIAPLFWVDEGLGSTIYLDGIVTLVDAKNVLRSLNEPAPTITEHEEDGQHGLEMTTAHLQISHADVIILNKTDLVTTDELTRVKERVQSINRLARIQITSHSQVPQLDGFLLDLHAYDSVRAEDLEFASKGHSHLDPTISTITLSVPPISSSQLAELDAWLRSLLWESALPRHGSESGDSLDFEVHRTKGRIQLCEGSTKLIQGVREVFEMFDERESPEDKATKHSVTLSQRQTDGKLVLVGRGLDEETFSKSLKISLESRQIG